MPRNPTTGVYDRVSNTFSEPVLGDVIDPNDANSLWDDLTDALNDIPGQLITPGDPDYPVVHPSSTNFQGAGYPKTPQYLRSDENVQLDADVIQMFSTDPSAGIAFTVGGTVTVGDVITMRFVWGANDVSVSYTTQTGDGLEEVVLGLLTAIANNATLFSLNGWTCVAGEFIPPVGVTDPPLWGGYESGALISLVVPVTLGATAVAIDYDAREDVTFRYTVTGGATETITVPAGYNDNVLEPGGSTPNTPYLLPNAFDNNPAMVFSRFVEGMAPAPFSLIFALYATGNDSSDLTQRNINYGALTHLVIDSTDTQQESRWTLQTVDTTGALGPFFAQQRGAFTTNGSDQGLDTIDAHVGFYIAEEFALWKTSNRLQIDTFLTNKPIVFNTGGGIGVNSAPTGAEFNSGLGMFVSGTQVPTTGSGWSLQGGTTPVMAAKNYATAAWLATSQQALSFDFRPSGSTTTGLTISANSILPNAANATTLGSAAFPFSNIGTVNILLDGSTSGTLTVKAAATAGTNTLTFPAGTTNFSATGGSGQVVKQTSAGGAFTVATVDASELAGLGTGVATWLATPSSANLRSAMTDESGTGALLFQSGALGTPASGTLTSCTGLPSGTGITAAWTNTTPTPTPGGGAFTATSSVDAISLGANATLLVITITVSNAGTGTGNISLTLPVTPAKSGALTGQCLNNGKTITGSYTSGSATMTVTNYDASSPIAVATYTLMGIVKI